MADDQMNLNLDGLPEDGAARYYAKREVGISPRRSDGSSTDPETDRQATAAEAFAADLLGAEFDGSVVVKPEKGFNFSIRFGGQPYSVQAIWAGWADSKKRIPRKARQGRLIVNLYEPHRHASIYVLVYGSIEHGFGVGGWLTHEFLMREGNRRDTAVGPNKITYFAWAMWETIILRSLIAQGGGPEVR